MQGEPFTPATAANRLTHWLDAAAMVGLERFPVDVEQLALHVGHELRWPDPITQVVAADIDKFEGGLFALDQRRWALLYNKNISSSPRVRFTQAHELGHYLLHRTTQQSFECSQADMLHLGPDLRAMEAEADEFASNLLMPWKQFREATPAVDVDFDALSDASIKFGASLTATALRWIRATPESAILILSRDGFMDWAVSSEKARSNGAFFRTRGKVVELPGGSLAADDRVISSRRGEWVPLSGWFDHAHKDSSAREMKLVCDSYNYTLTLLHLSPGDIVWEPRAWGV